MIFAGSSDADGDILFWGCSALLGVFMILAPLQCLRLRGQIVVKDRHYALTVPVSPHTGNHQSRRVFTPRSRHSAANPFPDRVIQRHTPPGEDEPNLP